MESSVLSWTAEATATCLDQGEICSTQDCFGVSQGINLAGTSFLAHFEVLQQPIALSMQRLDVLESRHQRLGRRRFLFGVSFHIGSGVSFGLRFVSQCLRVSGPLFCRVTHCLFVISLRIFLCSFGLCHLLVEIFDE